MIRNFGRCRRQKERPEGGRPRVRLARARHLGPGDLHLPEHQEECAVRTRHPQPLIRADHQRRAPARQQRPDGQPAARSVGAQRFGGRRGQVRKAGLALLQQDSRLP